MARFFFFTYLGLVVLAGAWGMIGYVNIEFKMLMELDLHSLDERSRINMLSQYRFLRGLEMGFGIWALTFRDEIFHHQKWNVLFLFAMGMGIFGRISSWLLDGSPNWPSMFFLFYEAIGWLIIFVHTRKTLSHAYR
ncbi:DUF4345 family protein [Negadavirga shengliensis]|uniref:DUF4345 family protein n=1 Tax=Negadavirga shengliensis TaxID=1389218 RepID=A0ABV9T5F8_9BACT